MRTSARVIAEKALLLRDIFCPLVFAQQFPPPRGRGDAHFAGSIAAFSSPARVSASFSGLT